MNNLQIRGQLYLRGETIAAWAERRGYQPGTVQRIIHRWTNPRARYRIPRGPMTRAILRDLSTDVGQSIPEGMDWQTGTLARTHPAGRRPAAPQRASA